MEKIKKTMKCPKCNATMKKVDKFCPGCGHYVGRGQRSPNEIRALVVKIKRTIPEIKDEETAQWYLAFMQGTISALTWATGEMDKTALDIAAIHLGEKNGKN